MTKEESGIIPEVTYHKNGFELRSTLLSVAADFVKWQFEYNYKLGGHSAAVTIKPPTYQDVLEAAQAWNKFLCSSGNNTRNNKNATSKPEFLQEGGDR